MNVVISMTSREAKMIQMEAMKTIVRSRAPYYFNTDKNVVYVVEKGTERIALMLRIERLIEGGDRKNMWAQYGSETGMKKGVWTMLQLTKKPVTMWVISEVWTPSRIVDYKRLFCTKRMPRLFNYTKLDPEDVKNLVDMDFLCAWTRAGVG